MNWDIIYQRVSEETGIDKRVVKTAYRLYWRFIKDTISVLPLKEDLTEEEFGKLRTNFNIPSLGKLCLTWDRYVGMKKRFRYLIGLREKNK